MANHKILVNEIETLAAHLGKSFAVTAKEYSIYLEDNGYCVSSRLKYLRFYEDYNTAKKAMQYKEKVASGVATWKKSDGQWLILVEGSELQAGDTVTVERKDGSKSSEVIGAVAGKMGNGTLYKVGARAAVEKQANTNNRDSGNPAELARTVGRGLGLGDDVEIWDEEEMENIRRRRAR